MRRRIFQALESLQGGTRSLYAACFFILFLFLFWGNSAQAGQTPLSERTLGGTIEVRAVVPVTPEFAYTIRKNSSLAAERRTVAVGQAVPLILRIAGVSDEPLRGHKLRLLMTGQSQEEEIVVPGETDSEGIARFTLVPGESSVGENIIRAIDVTYERPIYIQQTVAISISALANGKGRDQDRKQERGTDPSDSRRPEGLPGEELFTSGSLPRNSDIIPLRALTAQVSRFGPDDP